MNKHIFLDRLTASMAALASGRKKFFSRSTESPGFQELVNSIQLELPEIKGEQTFEVKAKSPGGMMNAAVRVEKWMGSGYPTLIYHHGNNERPFENKKGAKNTFFHFVVRAKDEFDANLIVVRAPFHNCKLGHYQEKMQDLQNFMGMIAVSVKVNECIIAQMKKNYQSPVITMGISLGGWVTNLHRSIFNTADLYVPLLAGALLGELFISSNYRKLVAQAPLKNPVHLREKLNFETLFKKQTTPNVFPLLARYDQFIEFEVQKGIYSGYPLQVLENGHVSAALNTQGVRKHLLESVVRLKEQHKGQ